LNKKIKFLDGVDRTNPLKENHDPRVKREREWKVMNGLGPGKIKELMIK